MFSFQKYREINSQTAFCKLVVCHLYINFTKSHMLFTIPQKNDTNFHNVLIYGTRPIHNQGEKLC